MKARACLKAATLLLLMAIAIDGTAQALEDFGYARNEATGGRPLLVILTDFEGSPGLRSADPVPDPNGYFENLAFNNFGSPSNPSLMTYFQEISNGRFYWYRAGVLGPYKFKPMDLGTDKNQKLTRLTLALKAAADDGFDFSQFDQDGDGTVRTNELGVMVVDNYSTDGGLSFYGANRFSDPSCFKPTGKEITLCLRGAMLGHYASFMTIAHELLHSVGKQNCLHDGECALDLYGGTGDLSSGYTIMSQTPSMSLQAWHLDPFHKIQFGWVEPRLYDMNVPQAQTLGAAHLIHDDQPIILYNSYALDEYFILEYRTNQGAGAGGYDGDVAGNGLVIWHVKVDANKVPIVVPSATVPNKGDRVVLMLGAPNMARGKGTAWAPATKSIFGSDSYVIPYSLQWLNGGDSGIQIKVGVASADAMRLNVSWGHFEKEPPPERKKILSYSQMWAIGDIGQFDDSDNYTVVTTFNTGTVRYSHVVADQAGIFYYDRTTGRSMLTDLDTAGNHHVLATFPAGYFGAGWTHIVSHRGYLFFYSAVNGMAAIGTLSSTGFRQYKFYPAGSFGTGWTHIVSTQGGLLYYAAGNGMGAVGDWEFVYAPCSSFFFPTVTEVRHKTLSFFPAGSFATGWTSIAETDNGVLFYRKSDGLQVMVDVLSYGNVVTRGNTFQYLKTGYTAVVPFGAHILFYDSSNGDTGVGKILTADPWVYSGSVGSLKLLQEWPSYLTPGWSHLVAPA